ncbi:uncharacterized protein [Henckelia pumila]|uniref:uncharacterized protein n=1 Tax=Henckelia pumila TaxID=405737 RepID=UPI003C6E30BC
MGHHISYFPEPKNVGTRTNIGATSSKTKENKLNAQVFTITQEEAADANDVIAGTILIKNYLLMCCLIAVQHIHLYLKRFSNKLVFEPITLVEPFRVATPTSKTIETHKVHRNCNVCINRHTFEATLIQLNMLEFNSILGMDWLSKNHTLDDYKRKNGKLRVSNQEEFIYHGKGKGCKSLLSASQTWKDMKSGEEIYLSMINEVKGAELRLEDIPVVQEFPDVFPEELRGIIPNRKVGFEINLVPGSAPISKEPYQMASMNLRS